MNIEDMTIEELRARAAEIRTAVNAPDADLDALDAEATQISERIAQYEREQRRRGISERVSGGEGTVTRTFQATAPNTEPCGIETEEYRSIYLRALQGRELSAAERRAYTAASGATATITLNRIMEQVRHHAPLLERMTTVYANGSVKIYVEGTTNEAKDHVENAQIKPDADTLTPITLTPAEITKMVQVSDAATHMSIDAFEAWLTATIGKAVARKINAKILTAAMAAAASAGSAIDAAGVQKLLGTVKGTDLALVCNNKTLYTKLLPLEDKSKNAIVTFAGDQARVYGRPVLLDDHMADDQLLCGDFTAMAGAMAEDVTVKRQFDIYTNSDIFLGVTVFDCKVGINAAFAKLAGA